MLYSKHSNKALRRTQNRPPNSFVCKAVHLLRLSFWEATVNVGRTYILTYFWVTGLVLCPEERSLQNVTKTRNQSYALRQDSDKTWQSQTPESLVLLDISNTRQCIWQCRGHSFLRGWSNDVEENVHLIRKDDEWVLDCTQYQIYFNHHAVNHSHSFTGLSVQEKGVKTSRKSQPDAF